MELLKNSNIQIIDLNTEKDDEIRFNLDSLEECNFKKMLRYYNSISMSPLEFLMTATLTALSGAIGKYAYWRFTENNRLYLNIWAVLLGISTFTKKTSAINLATQDLYSIEKLLREDYRQKKSNYEIKIKNKKPEEILDIPQPQREYLFFPNDITVEKLVTILQYSTRGLIIHSEFGSFLAQLIRSYSKDAKPFLTQLYDVPLIYEVSRVTKESILIERPYFAMIGASTLEWIKSNSSEDDLRTGFYARILFSIRNKNEKNFISVFDMNNLCNNSPDYFNTSDIYDFLTKQKEEKELQITPIAVKIYKEYELTSFKNLLDINNYEEISLKGRLVYYTLKIAGLLALADMRFVVNEKDMRNAIKISEYYKKNIEKLINDELLTKSKFSIKEEIMLKEIQHSGVISRTNLMLKKIAIDKKEFDRIIENLLEKDQIEVIIHNKEKRKKAISYKAK